MVLLFGKAKIAVLIHVCFCLYRKSDTIYMLNDRFASWIVCFKYHNYLFFKLCDLQYNGFEANDFWVFSLKNLSAPLMKMKYLNIGTASSSLLLYIVQGFPEAYLKRYVNLKLSYFWLSYFFWYNVVALRKLGTKVKHVRHCDA